MPRQRVDQWLWFARLTKSRTLAANLIAQGQVRLNRAKIGKPSHDVMPGDVLTIAIRNDVKVVRVLGIGKRRGPSPEAQALYETIDSSNG